MEFWKEFLPGYEVSTMGRVRSFKQYSEGRILSFRFVFSKNYRLIRIVVDGKEKCFAVHRLVAQAFIPNPDNKPEVNHINGDKFDNRVENLEWVTHSENMLHAFDTKLQISLSGENHPMAKLTAEQVVYIRINPDALTGKALAQLFGISPVTISDIQCGKIWQNAGGNCRASKRKNVPNSVCEEIKRIYVPRSQEFGQIALAKKFGLNPRTVRKIINGK